MKRCKKMSKRNINKTKDKAKDIQVLILAAGEGIRLKPITDDIPKTLVEVRGIPFVVNALDALAKHKEEVKEVIIVVGYKKELIKKRIGDKYNGMLIRYVDNDEWKNTNNIYSLWLARHLVTEDFILMEGDIFFEHNILNPIFENRDQNIAFLSKYHYSMSGTVVEIDEKSCSIKKLIPASDQGINFDYSNKYKTVNIYYFTYDFFEKYFVPSLDLYIKTHGVKSYWEMILGVLIYLSTPNIYGHILDRKTWYEVDTENDLEMANYLFSKKDERIYKLENLYGGYWRYDFLDFCFLFNLYFPAQHFYSKFSNELPFLIGNYPSAQHKIRSLMSQLYTDDSFSKENILVGNGSSEFIRILNRNFIRKITIPVPSFNEYEDLDKSKINYFILPEKKEFMLEADPFIEAVIKSKSNYALIINPNNPTGSVIERDILTKIIENLKHLDGIIVDESFIDFTGNRKKYSVQSLVNEYPNLILLRSLSKEFGIPGLRVGYLVSSNKDIKNKVGEYLPIWNINSLAEKFIELLPKYQKEYQKSIQKIINDKKIFCKNLKNIRMLKVFDGKANFVFCKILSKKINSTQLRYKLFEEHGLLIKDCSNKTALNDKFVRISVRRPRENNILVNALKMIEREIGE